MFFALLNLYKKNPLALVPGTVSALFLIKRRVRVLVLTLVEFAVADLPACVFGLSLRLQVFDNWHEQLLVMFVNICCVNLSVGGLGS